MGIFDIQARTWQAPTRQEMAHKSELHALEDAEDRKRREMKNELDTLKKVEDMRKESEEEARDLLNANARDAARRRAVSGLTDREALLLAQREHNSARLRNSAAHPQSRLSPNMSMLGSPAMSGMGMVPTIHVPSSPVYLNSGMNLPMAAGPRMRSVSTHHPPAGIAAFPSHGQQSPMGMGMSPSLGMHGSPGLGLPLPRPRAASHVGLGTPATAERLRLEERKRNLMQKEAQLQNARERRLLEKKSMLDLDAQEIALRKRAQDLDNRAKLEAHDRFLDNQEVQLKQRERDLAREAELTQRLNNLTVNTPSLNPLLGSPNHGHTRHASSPMALAADGGFSPYRRPMGMGGSPHLGGNSLGADLLMGGNPGASGRLRSGSMGRSPMIGTHDLDAAMAADAARLGVPFPSGLGMDGRPHGGMGYGLDDRAAAYARAGASPRFNPVDAAYGSGYGSGGGGVGGFAGQSGPYDNNYDLGLDGLGMSGNRSRRGSLSNGGGGGGLGYDLGGGQPMDMGYDPSLGGRGRRDSLPFQY